MLLSNLPQQESEQEFARRYSEQDYTPCEYHQRAIWNTQMEIANAARACHVQHRQPPCQIHRLPPIIFIDAQNKISHFHIENITTSPALKNSLECQFPDVGLVKVKRGEFAIRRRGELMDVDMSSPFHEWFVPGGEYNMSFVFDAEEERTATCPSCHARSDAAPGDETQCCGIRFCRVTEEGSLSDNTVMGNSPPSDGSQSSARPRPRPTRRPDQVSDFRRVKLVHKRFKDVGGTDNPACQCHAWLGWVRDN
ncbi:hypothetical protein FOPE_07034 [Fonsecaea pedrosoi]|nr:hypothetical protein FOPE_07034 [Fonsecaea pedrosoi]